ALITKGAGFAQKKDYVGAAQEFMQARRLAPPDCTSLLDGLLAVTYHAEGALDDKAAKLAAPGCTDTERVPAACAVLSEVALEKKDPDSAIRYAELANRDDYVPLVLALGDAFQMKHELDKAWVMWKRVAMLGARAQQQGASPRRMKQIERALATGVPPPIR